MSAELLQATVEASASAEEAQTNALASAQLAGDAERAADRAEEAIAEAQHEADNIVAGAAEAGVAAAQAGAALASVRAAQAISENQEDMNWLRNEVTRQGTVLAETTTLLATVGSQVLAMSETLDLLTRKPEAEEVVEETAVNPESSESPASQETPRRRRHRLL